MINILGFVLLIVFTVFAYKTAKDYGRNAIGWASITFFTGIGIQIILPGFILFFIALAATVAGSSTSEIENSIPFFTLAVACIFLSLVAGVLILKHLSKIPEEKPFDAPPAPPADFNQNS